MDWIGFTGCRPVQEDWNGRKPNQTLDRFEFAGEGWVQQSTRSRAVFELEAKAEEEKLERGAKQRRETGERASCWIFVRFF